LKYGIEIQIGEYINMDTVIQIRVGYYLKRFREARSKS